MEPLKGNALRARLKAAGVRNADIARYLGVSRPFITQMVDRGIPHKHVIKFERLTGIPARELQPEMFE